MWKHREGTEPKRPASRQRGQYSYTEDVDEAPKVVAEEPVEVEREAPDVSDPQTMVDRPVAPERSPGFEE